MEKVSGQIRRTLKILTGPFSRICHLKPISDSRCNLTVQRVALKFVFSMTHQTFLIQETSADQVLSLIRTTINTKIMLLRWCPMIIEFFKPIRISIRVSPFLPNTCSIINSSSFQRSLLISFDTLHYSRGKNVTTTLIGRSTIEVLSKSVRIHNIRYTNSV